MAYKQHLTFKQLYIGEHFQFNGTTYIKQSTRTARIQASPSIWFYFSQKDQVIIHPGVI